VRVVIWLAWARLRHRPARWMLIALGVAAATVLPVSAESSGTVVAAQALRHGLESLPVGDRTLVAIRSGLRESPQNIAQLDQAARRSLAELAAGPVQLQMLTRSISDGVGGSFYFGAADGLPRLIRITSGRLPTTCTPTRCEVVAVGSANLPRLDPAFGIVVVGRAVRTDPLLLSGSFDPGDGAPLLIADGVANAAQLDYLSAFQRSYAWVTPVDLDRVNALGVDGYLARSAQANVEFYGLRLTLTAPDDILREQAARAQGSARRFALLGGAATALLLGFAVIGAVGLRADHGATVDLLRRRGAGRAQVAVLLGITAAVPVVIGTAARGPRRRHPRRGGRRPGRAGRVAVHSARARPGGAGDRRRHPRGRARRGPHSGRRACGAQPVRLACRRPHHRGGRAGGGAGAGPWGDHGAVGGRWH